MDEDLHILLLKLGFIKLGILPDKFHYYKGDIVVFKRQSEYIIDIDVRFSEYYEFTTYIMNDMVEYLNSMFKHKIRKQKINNLLNFGK